MNRNVILVTVVAIIISACPHIVSAVTILDPAYSAQEYKTYPIENGWQAGMAFDSSGNLYISHKAGGCISRIDSNNNAEIFVSGLDTPTQMVWGGGTPYGDNLFVTDVHANNNRGRVMLITPQGIPAVFCTPDNQPTAIGIDRLGGYGGDMYCGTGGKDHIDSISSIGAVQRFSDFPYDMGGSPMDIEFDPGIDYGGSMYVATYSGNNSQWAGVFSLDVNGNPSRFAPDIVNAAGLEFDAVGLFDNELIIRGMLSDDTCWTIYSSDPSGQISPLAQGSWGHIFAMTMGPDGALYVAEYNNGLSVISRIVPEPASLALLAFGTVRLLRRRKKHLLI